MDDVNRMPVNKNNGSFYRNVRLVPKNQKFSQSSKNQFFTFALWKPYFMAF